MIPRITLRKALADRALLGGALAGESWRAWGTLLIAAMGEALTADERPLFTQLTGGREHEPGQRVEEFEGVIGRRGGKSRANRCWQSTSPACASIPHWCAASAVFV